MLISLESFIKWTRLVSNLECYAMYPSRQLHLLICHIFLWHAFLFNLLHTFVLISKVFITNLVELFFYWLSSIFLHCYVLDFTVPRWQSKGFSHSKPNWLAFEQFISHSSLFLLFYGYFYISHLFARSFSTCDRKLYFFSIHFEETYISTLTC